MTLKQSFKTDSTLMPRNRPPVAPIDTVKKRRKT